MSKSQRTKGAAGERELCRILRDELGIDVHREIGQVRDGGCDIKVGPFNVEVKRRARIGGIYDWIGQAEASCEEHRRPVVVCRADGKRWMVVQRLEDWIQIAREEIVCDSSAR